MAIPAASTLNKSTIVRSSNRHPKRRRATLPSALGWLATQLFCTTPRRRRLRPAERRILRQAAHADLAFEGRRLRMYEWGGDGPAVLLVHGWGGHAGQFHALITELVAEGRRVIAFDHPGHGRSAGHSTDIAQMARAVDAVVRWTGTTSSIVAHSLGAPAVALASARSERIAFIAAAAVPGTYWDMLSKFLRLSKRTKHEGARHVFARTGVTFDEAAMLQSLDGFDGDMMFAHDPDDRVTSAAAAADVAAKHERATLLYRPNTGHRRILSDPGLLAAVVEFARV